MAKPPRTSATTKISVPRMTAFLVRSVAMGLAHLYAGCGPFVKPRPARRRPECLTRSAMEIKAFQPQINRDETRVLTANYTKYAKAFYFNPFVWLTWFAVPAFATRERTGPRGILVLNGVLLKIQRRQGIHGNVAVGFNHG